MGKQKIYLVEGLRVGADDLENQSRLISRILDTSFGKRPAGDTVNFTPDEVRRLGGLWEFLESLRDGIEAGTIQGAP